MNKVYGEYQRDPETGELTNHVFKGVAREGTEDEVIIEIPRSLDYVDQIRDLTVHWTGEGGDNALADILLSDLESLQAPFNNYRDGCEVDSPCLTLINLGELVSNLETDESVQNGERVRPETEEMQIDIGKDVRRIVLLRGYNKPGDVVSEEDKTLTFMLSDGREVSVYNMMSEISSDSNVTHTAFAYREEGHEDYTLVFVFKNEDPDYSDPKNTTRFQTGDLYSAFYKYCIPKKYLDKLRANSGISGTGIPIDYREGQEYHGDTILLDMEDKYKTPLDIAYNIYYKEGTLVVH